MMAEAIREGDNVAPNNVPEWHARRAGDFPDTGRYSPRRWGEVVAIDSQCPVFWPIWRGMLIAWMRVEGSAVQADAQHAINSRRQELVSRRQELVDELVIDGGAWREHAGFCPVPTFAG